MTLSSRRDFFRRIVAMAPMATGGNLPYRRLCREYGAVRTCSEMILAHKLVKGGEGPLLRHHESEADFGVQLTGKRPEVVAEAAVIAAEAGACFIDLNFGCPIDLVVRKGAGAAMMRRPGKLAAVVGAVREAVDLPLSVKIRSGYSQQEINGVKVARLAQDAGADAVCVHGRTRNQRYRLSADWSIINEVAEAVEVPVIGNGDILTCWDLEKHRAETRVESFLVARGALIKPWLFRELKQGQPLDPDVPARWAMMRRYFELAGEHFGDDEKGLTRVKRFFLWHLGFWNRFHPWTEDDFHRLAPNSLLQARNPNPPDEPELLLLGSSDQGDHELIWRRILDRDYPSG